MMKAVKPNVVTDQQLVLELHSLAQREQLKEGDP